MTKREIRTLIWKSLTERPKKWAQVVDRAIWILGSSLVGMMAFVNNNGGVLLLIVWSVLLGLLALYLTAKGR